MKKSNGDSSKLDRKTIEKNRRIHMKNLCFKLTSLIPPQHFKPSKEMLSQRDQIDQAAAYVKQLRERIEDLKKKKELAISNKHKGIKGDKKNTIAFGLASPIVEIREIGSSIEVILVSALEKNFMLYEVISILEEGGAQVTNANYWTVNDKVFHSIHAEVKISRVGVDTSSICLRLQDLIY